MSHTPITRIDIKNLSINRRFFIRTWQLVKPFWWRKQAWPWHMALAALALLVVGFSAIGAWSSYLYKDQTDALIEKDSSAFWYFLALFAGLTFLRYMCNAIQIYVDGMINLHWRRWLTTYMVDRYLQRRTYFEITQTNSIDNPDQRIQEEIGPFCSLISMLPRQLFGSVLDMGVQAAILMSISSVLFWSVVIFALIKTVLMIMLYKPTIRQSYDITVAEADLRYGLLHVRDHAETVAFYQGESAERQHILSRLSTAFQKGKIQIVYQAWLSMAYGGFALVWTVLPVLLLAPMYFSDQLGYGSIAQGTAAAAALLGSLSILLNFVPTITMTVPKVVRLAEIMEKFEEMGVLEAQDSQQSRITLKTAPAIKLSNICLETPGGEQQLVQHLNLSVKPGQHLIIMGRTGTGKSSLLRAMAGLWTRGSGTIEMPPTEHTLFLPQKPYMVLADLRTQLLYPRDRENISDQSLQATLERVGLPNLIDHHGGLSSVKDWGKILSLGEQQRIAFARALISQAHYVFLDEATSAVDMVTEANLYQALQRAGATLISVGHRPSLLAYHPRCLQLYPNGKWTIEDSVTQEYIPISQDSLGLLPVNAV